MFVQLCGACDEYQQKNPHDGQIVWKLSILEEECEIILIVDSHNMAMSESDSDSYKSFLRLLDD